ncbi:MAG: hypothetical protein ACYSUN_11310 [Planctomycetota bacterium]|jgi:hypothetical protein
MADWELPRSIQDLLATSFAAQGPEPGVLDRDYYFRDGTPKPWWNRPPWKQPIDQTAHCVVGLVAGACLDRAPLVTVVVVGYVHGREQSQGKSRRKYDPHLDWIFYCLGFYLGRLIP